MKEKFAVLEDNAVKISEEQNLPIKKYEITMTEKRFYVSLNDNSKLSIHDVNEQGLTSCALRVGTLSSQGARMSNGTRVACSHRVNFSH